MARETWYGYQTLASDAAAALLLVSGAALSRGNGNHPEATPFFVSSALIYGAGAPAIHLLHDEPIKALGSIGLRAAPFAIGGLIWTAACAGPTNKYGKSASCDLAEGAGIPAVVASVGIIVAGTIIAVAVDAAAIARE